MPDDTPNFSFEDLAALHEAWGRMKATGDPNAQDLRDFISKTGYSMLHPEQNQGMLARGWDWMNRGLISKDTMVRALTGYTPEQLNKELAPYPEESPLHAGVREMTRGVSQDIGELASSTTSPLSLGMLGVGEAAASKPGMALIGAAARKLGKFTGALGELPSKVMPAWDWVTGYTGALKEAQAARAMAAEAAEAGFPKGQAGVWAKLNEALGVQPKAIRAGQGVSDVERIGGIPGRALETEGFDPEALIKLNPQEQTAALAPRWTAAGKAVRATAERASQAGVRFDGGKSLYQTIKGLPTEELQGEAMDIIHGHMERLNISNLAQMTPEEALDLRQALKLDANFSPTAVKDSLKAMGAKLYRAVSGDLHEAVPDLVAVDQHYGDLSEAMSTVRRNMQKFVAGKWKPTVTAVEKAEEAAAKLPQRGPFNQRALRYGAGGIGLGAATRFLPVLRDMLGGGER